MIAVIKDLYSSEVEYLENYIPDDPECFCVNIQLIAGPSGQKGEESFDIKICTPQWLIENYNKDEIILGRHKLIVFEYNFQRIYHRIESYLRNCNGESWEEIGPKIARLGHWEFEDYRP